MSSPTEGDKPTYDPRFPPGHGSWRNKPGKTDQPDPSCDSPLKATKPEELTLIRKYPDVSITDEIDLRTLEGLLQPKKDPDTSWIETVTILERTGYWGQQVWHPKEIERNLEPDYREALRTKIVAKLYEGLSRNPLAETLARQIIANNPLQPVT